jgi:hypothetical protein
MSSEKSLSSLSKFLDYLSDKGLMDKQTAMSRKSTANLVLGSLSDLEAIDVTTVDVDTVMRRFENLNRGKYTPGSLRTYRSRLASAIEDFISYSDNPMSFRPATVTRERKQKETQSVKNVDSQQRIAINHSGVITDIKNVSPMIVPIPIRINLTIQIHGLPFDLTPQEARKISAVIVAMASEPVEF